MKTQMICCKVRLKIDSGTYMRVIVPELIITTMTILLKYIINGKRCSKRKIRKGYVII